MAKKMNNAGPGDPKKKKVSKVSKLPLGSTVDAKSILKNKGMNTRDYPLPSSDGMFENSNPESSAPKPALKPSKWAAESYAKKSSVYKKEFQKHMKNFSSDKRAMEYARKGNSVTDFKPSDLPRLQAKATQDSTMMMNNFKQYKRYQKLASQNVPKGSAMINGKVVKPKRR